MIQIVLKLQQVTLKVHQNEMEKQPLLLLLLVVIIIIYFN